MTTELTGPLAPLRKTVVVPLDQARAFDLFTAGMAQWWPLVTHSVGLADAELVTFPDRVGDQIVETGRGGATCSWGTLTGWDAPSSVSFTWHPGSPESEAGSIDVRFIPLAGDRTMVELTHSGWAARSDGAQARTSYDSGWDVVLGGYDVTAAGATR
jgi:hypothetical protein